MRPECDRCRKRLSEYLDGELRGTQLEALEAHLRDCAECTRELESWRRMLGAVADLPARKPASGFAGRVLARLGEARPGGAPAVLSVVWMRVLPVAAMFLLVLGLTFGVPRWAGRAERGAAEPLTLAQRLDLPAPATPAPVGEPPVESLLGLYHARDEREALPVAAAAPELAAEEVADRGWASSGYGVSPAAEAARTEDTTALGERSGLRAARGRRVAGPAAAPGAPPSVEAAAGEPALSYRFADETEERLEEAVPRSTLLMFTQVAAAEPARWRGPAQQVLTLAAPDPTALARRAVMVANANGLAASLALSGEGGAGTVDVYLAVPVAQYDALMRDLSGLAEPETQALSNTRVARGEFFQVAKLNYEANRETRKREQDMLKSRTAGVALVAGSPGGVATARERRRADADVSDGADAKGAETRPVKALAPTAPAARGVVDELLTDLGVAGAAAERAKESEVAAALKRPVPPPRNGRVGAAEAGQPPDGRGSRLGRTPAPDDKLRTVDRMADPYTPVLTLPAELINLLVRIGTPEALMPADSE